MIDNDEPYLPPEPFIKELKRIYNEKYEEDFIDFFIDSITFWDDVEAGFTSEEKIKAFRIRFCNFARFFIPLENLTRVMVNNLKTKEARDDYEVQTVESHLLYKMPENKNNS